MLSSKITLTDFGEFFKIQFTMNGAPSRRMFYSPFYAVVLQFSLVFRALAGFLILVSLVDFSEGFYYIANVSLR